MNGRIYVLGGEEGWDRYHDTIECYDPQEDKWDIVGEMSSSRSWLSCVGLTVSVPQMFCNENPHSMRNNKCSRYPS